MKKFHRSKKRKGSTVLSSGVVSHSAQQMVENIPLKINITILQLDHA